MKAHHLLPALLLIAGTLRAAEPMLLEIIPLRHRLVADILPVLQPLLADGGTVTGANGQIIVRSTPGNIADLRAVLATIDSPYRRLLITVRQDSAARFDSSGQALSGAFDAGDARGTFAASPGSDADAVVAGGDSGATVRYRTYGTESYDDRRNEHRVQTLEGQPAFIRTGQSVPYGSESVIVSGAGAVVTRGIEYRDVDAGVYVVPYVNGDRVTLRISPRLDRLAAGGGGTIETQAVDTTIAGSLGQWLPLAGASQDEHADDAGMLASTRRAGAQSRGIWVRVEELH